MKLARCVAATVLIVGGTAGCGEDEPSDAPGPKGQTGSSPTPDNETRTQDGPVTWGSWQAVGKVTPTKDKTGQFALSMRIKNIGPDPKEAFTNVTVLEGGAPVAKLDCSSNTIRPNQTGTLECLSADSFVAGWDNLTFAAGS